MKYTATDISNYLKEMDRRPWFFETWTGCSIVYTVFIDKEGLLTPEYPGGMYKYEMCCDIPKGETMLEFRAKHERIDYQPFYEICAALADQASKPKEEHQAIFLVDHYYSECLQMMDADIMDSLDAAGYDNEYKFFAAYLLEHRKKYAVDFII